MRDNKRRINVKSQRWIKGELWFTEVQRSLLIWTKAPKQLWMFELSFHLLFRRPRIHFETRLLSEEGWEVIEVHRKDKWKENYTFIIYNSMTIVDRKDNVVWLNATKWDLLWKCSLDSDITCIIDIIDDILTSTWD